MAASTVANMGVSTVASGHARTLSASNGAAENKAYRAVVRESYNDWRVRVESNEVAPWQTVPQEYSEDHKAYMTGGQYETDLNIKIEEILSYARGIVPAGDGKDAWIFDVDDTCISNVTYYQRKDYGCKPFDSAEFREWIVRGECPAIPDVLKLFEYLIDRKFQVFLLTGRRDEEVLGKVTIDNLHSQGFIGYERLIFRSAGIYTRGESVVKYKSVMRKQIQRDGYRIWGIVGDQWSDIQGECLGFRNFKLPNPMYHIF